MSGLSKSTWFWKASDPSKLDIKRQGKGFIATNDRIPFHKRYTKDIGVLEKEASSHSPILEKWVKNRGFVRFVLCLKCSFHAIIFLMRFRVLQNLNRVCLWLGISICFGMSLIGNFQLENSFKKDISVLQDSTVSFYVL